MIPENVAIEDTKKNAKNPGQKPSSFNP